MNRREFFKLAFASMAASGLLVGTAEAVTRVNFEDPYVKSIKLGQEVVALDVETKKHPIDSVLWKKQREKVNAKIDDFLLHCVEKCDGVPSCEYIHGTVFVQRTNLIEGGSDQILKSAIPIAVFRELIKTHYVAINVPSMQNLSMFCEKYKRSIV